MNFVILSKIKPFRLIVQKFYHENLASISVRATGFSIHCRNCNSHLFKLSPVFFNSAGYPATAYNLWLIGHCLFPKN